MARRTPLLAATLFATLAAACAPGDFLSGGGGDGTDGDAAVEGGDDAGDEGGDQSNTYPAAGGYGMDLGSGYPTLGGTSTTDETDQDAGAVFDAATSG
jgi:hypothetical protein